MLHVRVPGLQLSDDTVICHAVVAVRSVERLPMGVQITSANVTSKVDQY